MSRLKSILSKEDYTELEGVMWILRKNHECLTQDDKDKLKLLYKHSPKLKEAHSYALKLTHIFNSKISRKSAIARINRWITRVEKSNTQCFNSFIKTLKKYKSYIANYFKKRKNSGFVEGLNNKIKVAKRRCYGFFKTESLFQRLFLDLQGYEVYA
jgi:transposase